MTEPTGSEIARRHADRYRGLAKADALLAERKPCPICGHETGDCTGRDHVVAERQRDGNFDGVTTAPSPETLALIEPWVVVTETVFETRGAPGGGPDVCVQRYVPGERILREVAEREEIPHRDSTLADLEPGLRT